MAIGDSLKNWTASELAGTNPAPVGIGPQGQAESNWWSGLAEGAGKLFNNPNFLKFLADTGAEIDPRGAGGALGRPTSRWIERQQIGEALAGQQKQGQAQLQELIKALAGPNNLTKLKVSPDGTVEFGGAAGAQGQGQESGLGSLEQPTAPSSETDEQDQLGTIEGALDNVMNFLGLGGE